MEPGVAWGIDGAWKIVDKTFVHTGGEPPALE
jgi:hypothetical protein